MSQPDASGNYVSSESKVRGKIEQLYAWVDDAREGYVQYVTSALFVSLEIGFSPLFILNPESF